MWAGISSNVRERRVKLALETHSKHASVVSLRFAFTNQSAGGIKSRKIVLVVFAPLSHVAG